MSNCRILSATVALSCSLLPPAPQPLALGQCPCPCPADLTGNTLRDGLDIDGFIRCALAGPSVAPGCGCADMNVDALVDLLDVPTFAGTLLAPGACAAVAGQYEPGPADTPPASPCREGRSCDGMPDRGLTDSAYLFNGEFYQSVTDLRIRGRGPDFVWARKYRSRSGPNTAMGNGWDHSYSIYIEAVGADRILHDGNSRADLYTLQVNGKWARDEFFRELQLNGDTTYTLVFADMGQWNFRSLTNPIAPGRISSIVDRNGNTLGFSCDAQGRLVTITDTLSRNVTVAYNGDGFISSVTDFTVPARQIVYSYYQNPDVGGSFGDLKSVRSPVVTGTPNGNDYPLGKTTTYTYSEGFLDNRLNSNLLTITDPKGQTYILNTYASILNPSDLGFDRLVRQAWGNPSDLIDLVYIPQGACAGNNFAAIKTIVNDRVGNVREFFYDGLNRLVMAREYTGRANAALPTTESANRPTAKLRPSDPDYFESRWKYNADSMTTLITHPNLNTTANTHELDLNPLAARRERGNLRQVTRNPGPLGGDQPSITESHTYATGFGGCGCGTNFVATHTDGRGNTTSHTHDPAGNRTHTTHRAGGGVEDWTYNAFGQMTSHTLPANGSGNRRLDTYAYHVAGPQLGYLQNEVVNSGGFNLTTQYEYDSVGNPTRTIHPNGGDTLHTFNALDQEVREQSRQVLPGARYETLYWYDPNDNVVRTDVQNRDESGVVQPNTHFTTIHEYEILNRHTRMCREKLDASLTNSQIACSAFPAGAAVTMEYQHDANRNQTLARDGEAVNGNDPFNTRITQYDERDLVFKSIRAAGSPTQSTDQTDYDGNGNTTATRQGLESVPRVTTYGYDGYDRRIGMRDAMGNLTSTSYDANGNSTLNRVDGELNDVPGFAGNVRLSEVTYQYDAMDRQISGSAAHFDTQTQAAIGDGFSITTTAYANNSQATSVTDDNGHTRTSSYDTANRVATVTDPKTNTTTYSYDSDSNVVLQVQLDKSDLGGPMQSFSTTYSYDALDRLIVTMDPIGNKTMYTYDFRTIPDVRPEPKPKRKTEPDGDRTRYSYDALDRLIQSSTDLNNNGLFNDPADSIILQTWDDSSRQSGQRDDNGNSKRYEYDSLDRLIRTIYADGTSDQRSYDPHDNPISSTDPNGSIVTGAFDLLNRPTNLSIVRAPGVLGTTSESYQYDGLSRMVRAEDDDSIVTRRYDSLGNVIIETQQVLPTGPLRTVTATYDGDGNQTRLVYPGGRVIVRTYDSLDRPSLVRDDPPSTIATYSYIGPYRVERRDYGNGTRFSPSYDGLRRMTGTLHTRISDGSIIDQRASAWSADSNRTSSQNVLLTPTQIRMPSYDRLDRLTSTNGGLYWNFVGYTLDGVGNRTAVTGAPDAGAYALSATTPEPADYQMNQYTGTPFDTRQYDKCGNLVMTSGQTAGATRTLAYDYRDQLVLATVATDGTATTYKYDCLGRRIQKVATQQPIINGTLDQSFYGSALSSQNTQTDFGDNSLGVVDNANGSELDAAHARVSDGVLYLMLTGNLESNFNKLEIFLSSISGGQNRLRGNNPNVDFNGLNRMGDDGSGNGLTFDAGFTADFWIGLTGGGGPYQLYANYAELLTAGGGQGYFLGQTGAASSGVLSGGTNPFNIRCTINNINTAGVIGGNGADSGAGVTTGMELAIPLAAIGNPATSLSICALVNGSSHDFVSNQVLGGIGGGGLGEPRNVNFGPVAGSQSFTVSAAPTYSSYYYDGSEEVEEQSSSGSTILTHVYSKGAHSRLQSRFASNRVYYHEDDQQTPVKTTLLAEIFTHDEYGDYGKMFTPGQTQAGDLNTIYDSDGDPSPDANAYDIADDFWFHTPTSISTVRWWGGYDYDPQVPTFDQFVVSIYDSDLVTGLPSSLLHQESFSFSQVTRSATDRSVCCAAIGAAPEYQYVVTLSTPFAAQANTRYWLAIVNNTSGVPSTWGWATSGSGDSCGAIRVNGGNWSRTISDSAFLLVPAIPPSFVPFRYHGYRLDSETGFYWTGGGYLDPRSGRINVREIPRDWDFYQDPAPGPGQDNPPKPKPPKIPIEIIPLDLVSMPPIRPSPGVFDPRDFPGAVPVFKPRQDSSGPHADPHEMIDPLTVMVNLTRRFPIATATRLPLWYFLRPVEQPPPASPVGCSRQRGYRETISTTDFSCDRAEEYLIRGAETNCRHFDCSGTCPDNTPCKPMAYIHRRSNLGRSLENLWACAYQISFECGCGCR